MPMEQMERQRLGADLDGGRLEVEPSGRDTAKSHSCSLKQL
jgi:hypothetical protein